MNDTTQSQSSMNRISEEDLRPAELMKRKESCIQWDREFLIQRKHRFVEVACPACNSERRIHIFDKYGTRYHQCGDCKTVYINPRPSQDLLREFYVQSKNYEFWNKWIFPASENARRENIFKPRVQLTLNTIKRFFPGCNSVMEVGAGFGMFCEELKKAKKFEKVIACEPTPDLAATCRKRGIETIEKPVEELSSDLMVDVIASFEVIEHLFSPKEFVESCNRHLSSKGLLILSCPNYYGFDVQTLGKEADTVDYEHLNYFHPASLRILLEQCEFRVIEITTPGKLDADIVRNKALNGVISLEGHPFLKMILFDRWEELGQPFQQFLTENGLSSHMFCIAQKVS